MPTVKAGRIWIFDTSSHCLLASMSRSGFAAANCKTPNETCSAARARKFPTCLSLSCFVPNQFSSFRRMFTKREWERWTVNRSGNLTASLGPPRGKWWRVFGRITVNWRKVVHEVFEENHCRLLVNHITWCSCDPFAAKSFPNMRFTRRGFLTTFTIFGAFVKPHSINEQMDYDDLSFRVNSQCGAQKFGMKVAAVVELKKQSRKVELRKGSSRSGMFALLSTSTNLIGQQSVWIINGALFVQRAIEFVAVGQTLSANSASKKGLGRPLTMRKIAWKV